MYDNNISKTTKKINHSLKFNFYFKSHLLLILYFRYSMLSVYKQTSDNKFIYLQFQD